ncbi:hypothetical protein GCM10029964_117430 [Kibdelosporangium lantanae]
MRRPALTPRLQPFTSTIFAEMTALAVRTNAVNLGQGFPDTDGPASMLAKAQEAIATGVNQYPPGPGRPELREAIAEHRTRYGTSFDPDTEILVTVGATEAIASALLGLAGPGDEVLLMEPYYDSYAACVALAGATRRVVPLVEDASGRFAPDIEGLRAAITPATRLLLLNSPHNPTGTVFTREELAAIAALCVEHDLIAVTDEVYEDLIFDGRSHVPLGTLPGMAERTLTISSAGKMFNCTGWKIGWMCGPAELVAAARAAKQFLTFVGGAPSNQRWPTRCATSRPGSRACAPNWSRSATVSSRASPRRASAYAPAKAPTSCARTYAHWASRTAWSSAVNYPNASASRPYRSRSSPTGPSSGSTSSASPSASRTRSSTKQWPACTSSPRAKAAEPQVPLPELSPGKRLGRSQPPVK